MLSLVNTFVGITIMFVGFWVAGIGILRNGFWPNVPVGLGLLSIGLWLMVGSLQRDPGTPSGVDTEERLVTEQIESITNETGSLEHKLEHLDIERDRLKTQLALEGERAKAGIKGGSLGRREESGR